MRTCSVENCVKIHQARGYCQMHYVRVRDYGTTDGNPMMSLEYRFHSKTDKSGECWQWLGGLNEQGYGQFYDKSRGHMVAAHRIAVELASGPIPPKTEVDHECRNRSCVNPKHLRLATRKQNMENLSQRAANTESGARGVTRTSGGRWCARVGHNKRLIHIGVYATMEEAAAAVVAKRLELHTFNHEDRVAA